MRPEADATLIIPTLGRVEHALALARRLQDLDPAPSRTVFVFQIASELKAWETRGAHLGPEGIMAPAIGASVARNFGAKQAKSRFLAFLDDDCVPLGQNWLAELLRPLQRSDVIMTTGPVHGWSNASRLGSNSNKAFQLATPLLIPWGNPESSKSSRCDTVAGGNFAMETAFFIELGGFSETFSSPSLYEETELSLRAMRERPGKIWFEAGAKVAHHQAKSGGMRTQATVPSEAFVVSQKAILLNSLHGQSLRAAWLILVFKMLRRLLSLLRIVKSKRLRRTVRP